MEQHVAKEVFQQAARLWELFYFDFLRFFGSFPPAPQKGSSVNVRQRLNSAGRPPVAAPSCQTAPCEALQALQPTAA
jgi:hypothetical protein